MTPKPLTSRSRVLLPLGLLVLVLLSYWRLRKGEGPDLHHYRGDTMGTTFSVTWRSSTLTNDPRPGIDAALAEVNASMSTYDPQSELSKFNRQRSTEWVSVSPELAQVVALAREVSELSVGAFDVTVRPLVAAWGFGQGASIVPPTERELQGLADRLGFEKLQVRLQPPGLRKAHPELEADLSAIAKGYGVDRIAAQLEAMGIGDYFIEVGGELRIAGEKNPGVAWRVGIEVPEPMMRETETVVEPGTTGFATSGDYRNYYERDGQRYSHTIDPRSRRPITHQLASVSVLDPTCARADALATALNVLGPDEGLRLAERAGLSVLMLVRTAPGQFEHRRTGWFAQQSGNR